MESGSSTAASTTTTTTSACGTGSSCRGGTTGCSPFSSTTAGKGTSAGGVGDDGDGDGGTSFGSFIQNSGTMASTTNSVLLLIRTI